MACGAASRTFWASRMAGLGVLDWYSRVLLVLPGGRGDADCDGDGDVVAVATAAD